MSATRPAQASRTHGTERCSLSSWSIPHDVRSCKTSSSSGSRTSRPRTAQTDAHLAYEPTQGTDRAAESSTITYRSSRRLRKGLQRSPCSILAERKVGAAKATSSGGVDARWLPCSPFIMKTYWDVYLEVRNSSHARTPVELGAVLLTDGASTRQALAALDKAQLVYSAVIGGVPVTYVVGKAAGTDDEAYALAAKGGLDISTEVAPYVS